MPIPLFISIRLAQDGYLGLVTRHSVGNGEPAPQALVNPSPTSRWERPGFGPSGPRCRLVEPDHAGEADATHIALWEPGNR
jgi:hypothetical protein